MCVHVHVCTYQLFPNLIPAAPPLRHLTHGLLTQIERIKLKEPDSVLSLSPVGCSFYCGWHPCLPWAAVDADGGVERQREPQCWIMSLSC